MDELFNITNCYQDTNYYYFFRALNKRDMTGIRNGSTLDEAGHISKIVTDSTFYNHKDFDNFLVNIKPRYHLLSWHDYHF